MRDFQIRQIFQVHKAKFSFCCPNHYPRVVISNSKRFEGEIVLLGQEISVTVWKVPELHFLIISKTHEKAVIFEPKNFANGYSFMSADNLGFFVGHVNSNNITSNQSSKGYVVSSDGDGVNGMLEVNLEG